MTAVAEVLGFAARRPPIPAVDLHHPAHVLKGGRTYAAMVLEDLTPRDICTEASFTMR